MTILYIIAGIFIGVIVLAIAVYTAISFALTNKQTPSLDEDQKSKCREAIKTGKASPLTCRIYVKKGKCPHRPCSNIE